MRLRFSGFVLASLALAPCLSAADRPPQGLHQVGDHWTAWNPPAPPAPPAKPQTHVIEKGDTLWDLAARYYGNPYLWPQLWEKNQYILDAHWIYPGDPLLLGVEVAPVEQLSGGGAAGGGEGTATPTGEPAAEPSEPVEGVLTSKQAAGAPVPLGAESDIYCSGFIGPEDVELPFAVTGSEYEKLLPDMHVGYSPEIVGRYGRVGVAKYELSTGDIVYLDGGRARGLTPGSIFMAVVPDRVVIHPVTKQPFGRYYHYAARVRVLSVQEATAIGEIVQSCDPIRIGTRLQPYEPEPVPLGRPTGMRPINFPTAEEKLQAAPVVLFAKDDVISLGQDHVVYIDRGADQVTPGDVFTIYRLNRAGSPPMPIGELAVLSVHKTSAVAKIIAARYPIYLGDRLDPK